LIGVPKTVKNISIAAPGIRDVTTKAAYRLYYEDQSRVSG
jgi:hypothetical protein